MGSHKDSIIRLPNGALLSRPYRQSHARKIEIPTAPFRRGSVFDHGLFEVINDQHEHAHFLCVHLESELPDWIWT
ncbi:hypothetical protein SBA3_3400031 [Candidatus Sulfopaludibacter sp. SbA3]|nr:hypothetical protein SBA3_3400031 [Candidatus Sulfopaludibacter sp. SbA3]